MLSASARRPQTTRPRRIYYKRRGRTGVPSAEQSNEIVQPPLTRDRLIRLERWLEYAAAFQPTVTAKTASLVSGTYDAILCTREEWRRLLMESPNTVLLSGNNFGEYVLLPTAIMGYVRKLELRCCNMTYVPDSIGRLTNLSYMRLPGNKLTSVPDSIGRLTNLTCLGLSYNRLTRLPDTIGRLTNLIHLDLRDNQLTNLPDSIGRLTSLIHLDLNSNQLTNLPNTFGHLQSLTYIDLAVNKLSSLPDSIGRLASLTKLDLSSNQLTSLPDSFGQLINLSDLWIDSNNLTSLPDTIVQLRNLIYWNMDRQLYEIINWSRYPGMRVPRWI